MLKFFILGMTGACLIATMTQRVSAKTYWCDASKKDAAVGITDSAAVSITADRRNQECRFSVNGETVGSPPRELVIGAHNALRNGSLPDGKGDDLAYALLASSPLKEIPTQLRTALQAYSGEIQGCFGALRSGTPGRYVSKDNVLCQVIPSGEPAIVGFGRGDIRVHPTSPNAPPQLVLAVNIDNSIEQYLFIPQIYISGTLRPLQ